MYEKFYHFSQKPFEVTPDPKFLFFTPVYREILSALIYGVTERRGFIALVGEVGTGKTLLLNSMIDRLESSVKIGYIFNSDLTFKQMLLMVLFDLKLVEIDEKISKIEAIQRLNEFAISQLEKGGNVVIIIDEAQNMSHRTMENLRMLSNLETRQHKLVQIVFAGQPEFDEKLRDPEWRQIVQRISLKRQSTKLDETDTYRYIQHRLKVAEYEKSALFSEDALKRIWQYSDGIPRKINILCDNSLLIGYGLEKQQIDVEIINEVIADLSWTASSNSIEGILKLTDENTNLSEETAIPDNYPEADPESGMKENSEPKDLKKLEQWKKIAYISIVVIWAIIFAVYWFTTKEEANNDNVSLNIFKKAVIQKEKIESG